MKYFIILLVFCASAYSKDIKSANSNSTAIDFKKVPKSMFLVKKAKLNQNIGEPILRLTDKQLGMINNDARLDNP